MLFMERSLFCDPDQLLHHTKNLQRQLSSFHFSLDVFSLPPSLLAAGTKLELQKQEKEGGGGGNQSRLVENTRRGEK